MMSFVNQRGLPLRHCPVCNADLLELHSVVCLDVRGSAGTGQLDERGSVHVKLNRNRYEVRCAHCNLDLEPFKK